MATPQDPDARKYYRSAFQRLEDAEFLLEARRTTGAVYLAGYGVECILKVLILSRTAPAKKAGRLASFRGARAHDYEWLKERYAEGGGQAFSKPIARQFALVSTWTNTLRYEPGTTRYEDAEEFVRAAREILSWADGRF
jgi:HEPN domain-containing protein